MVLPTCFFSKVGHCPPCPLESAATALNRSGHSSSSLGVSERSDGSPGALGGSLGSPEHWAALEASIALRSALDAQEALSTVLGGSLGSPERSGRSLSSSECTVTSLWLWEAPLAALGAHAALGCRFR